MIVILAEDQDLHSFNLHASQASSKHCGTAT